MTRISLLLSAALLIAAPTAIAQTYGISSQMSGNPQSSAQFGDDDLGFADYSPDQIASDVTVQYNPRTGAREFVAPTFDPFELEDDLAGTVSLRSTDGVRDLNNDPMGAGVLLDMSIFYTDHGDRPYGLTRDAVFLNGEPVPITLRDGRELECSARVTERIYRYDRLDQRYSGSPLWTRPYYYGYGGFGAYGGYGISRPYRRPVTRPVRRPRPQPVPRPRPGGVTPDRPSAGYTVDDSGQGRPRGQTDYYINGRKAGTKPKPDRRPRRPRRGADQGGGASYVSPDVRVTPQPNTRRTPVTRPAPRPERRPERTVVTPPPRPAVQPKPTPRPKPAPRPAPKQRADPVSKPRPRSNPSETTRIRRDMFPGDGYGSSVVVSSQRDCAREDQLTLFIPQDRLDAARFDGLTVVVRDVTYDPRSGQTTVYGERPVYIPPNYIEGFRLAQNQP